MEPRGLALNETLIQGICKRFVLHLLSLHDRTLPGPHCGLLDCEGDSLKSYSLLGCRRLGIGCIVLTSFIFRITRPLITLLSFPSFLYPLFLLIPWTVLPSPLFYCCVSLESSGASGRKNTRSGLKTSEPMITSFSSQGTEELGTWKLWLWDCAYCLTTRFLYC